MSRDQVVRLVKLTKYRAAAWDRGSPRQWPLTGNFDGDIGRQGYRPRRFVHPPGESACPPRVSRFSLALRSATLGHFGPTLTLKNSSARVVMGRFPGKEPMAMLRGPIVAKGSGGVLTCRRFARAARGSHRARAKSIAVPSCIRCAHAASQPIDIKSESFRSGSWVATHEMMRAYCPFIGSSNDFQSVR